MMINGVFLVPLHPGDLSGVQSRLEIFQQIFEVFLVLGTAVGVVVIGYMVYNAYKYRDDDEPETDDVERPSLGEIPTGGGKGRKLFLSFGISAVIVISLIVWTYGTLLYVESAPEQQDDALVVEVEAYQFGWDFTYPNGHTDETLRIPEDREVQLIVTSRDVFHNFGIPAFRVKTDAIPGQTSDTWFIAEETGTYEAQCYELCGVGHSYMTAEVEVMEPDEFQEWYDDTAGEESDGTETPEGDDGETSDEGDDGTETPDEGDDESLTANARTAVASPAAAVSAAVVAAGEGA